MRSTGRNTPPLLDVARSGDVNMVEWWLSDAPHRCYVEFSETQQAKNDKRLKQLGEAVGGFERAISKWLGAQSESSGCIGTSARGIGG